MMHSGGKPHTHVGDRGQRYEVRYYNRSTGEVEVMGWTNDPTGGGLLTSAKLWPRARDPFVVDRGDKS